MTYLALSMSNLPLLQFPGAAAPFCYAADAVS
jgi:hypothetical protein